MVEFIWFLYGNLRTSYKKLGTVNLRKRSLPIATEYKFNRYGMEDKLFIIYDA
jgi:hypothetical protein